MKKFPLVCSRCGAPLDVSSGRGLVFMSCPHCGSETSLLDEGASASRMRIAADLEYSRMEEERRLADASFLQARAELRAKLVLIAALTALFIALLLLATGWINSRATLPFSARDLQNRPAADVVCLFQDLGFDNIVRIQTRDLKDSWFHSCAGEVGQVSRVSVDGNFSFRKWDRFDRKAVVRIWVKSYP